MNQSVPATLPRIILLVGQLRQSAAPSPLALLARQLVPSYAGLAHIEVIDVPLEQALPLAVQLERDARVDVFVCTGATAAYLRKQLATPVLATRVGGRDLLRALDRARQLAPRVAIMSYRHTSAELERMEPLFTVRIDQRAYISLEQARSEVGRLVADGVQAIIGSSLVVELAAQAGVHGVLALSDEALREAFDDAIALCRTQRIEQAKREQISAVLQHLSEGVVALDRNGVVRSINPAMAALLGVEAPQTLGRRLAELAPALDGGSGQQDRIVKLGRRTVVANWSTVSEHGAVAGAVITCQEIHAVQRADRHIRNSTRPLHHIARYSLEQIAGGSAPMVSLLALARRYAGTDSTLLITGASGTGKELLAQGIHNASGRRRGPFVPINCAAFPETLLESELFGHEEGAFSGARKGGKMGLFEAAHGGTVFLDEIGDMPLPLQTRLLRVLQEREVLRLGATEATPINVRVIAATHCDLRARIADGRFREDLYYRINILRLQVPALQERGRDVLAVARAILQRLLGQGHSQLDALLAVLQPHLQAYHWPGNIRELENTLERAAVSAPELCAGGAAAQSCLRALMPEWFDGAAATPIAAQANLPSSAPLRAASHAAEVAHIHTVLNSCDGSIERAARRLGISRSTLWRRLKAP